MSDIFVSYARHDLTKARALAEALQGRGWSVWWDRNIPPGRSFDNVIEEALAKAKCVIVLWSQASASSDWVKTEAAEGARRKILVPALIQDVPIPLEFRRLQTANLTDWDGDSAHSDFDEFLKAIAALLGSAGPPSSVGPTRSWFDRHSKRIKRVALVGAGAIALATAGVVLRQNWPTPTAQTPTGDSVRVQTLSWGPDHGKDAGACIDGCTAFLPWSELRQELEQTVFPATRHLPRGASARLTPLGGQKDKLVQATDGAGNVLANVWVGVNPASDWKLDGVLRVGSTTSPPRVWASFERLSNGTYRRR
jgi:hypothetical protein